MDEVMNRVSNKAIVETLVSAIDADDETALATVLDDDLVSHGGLGDTEQDGQPNPLLSKGRLRYPRRWINTVLGLLFWFLNTPVGIYLDRHGPEPEGGAGG